MGDLVTEEEHLAVLKDESKSLVLRLRSAAQLEVDYWKDRKGQPNLDWDDFRKLINFIPLSTQVRWENRESDKGRYGRTGEDLVFNINFEVVRGRYKFAYYIKGYFFEKNNLKGVCIQSCRLEGKYDRRRLRIIS